MRMSAFYQVLMTFASREVATDWGYAGAELICPYEIRFYAHVYIIYEFSTVSTHPGIWAAHDPRFRTNDFAVKKNPF
jgi:hypothetical protein